MKKVFLLAAATVLATAGFSQIRYGVQVIGNAGSVSTSSQGLSNFKTPMQVGFGGGLVADIPLSNDFSIRPSLNFLQKKSTVEFTTAGTDKKSTIKSNLNYLELPVNLVYKVPVGSASLYFGAGPLLGYGISGKMKFHGYESIEGVSHEVNESTEAFKKESAGGAGLKRFDLSANANAGLQFNNGLYVNAGYLMGLTNLVDKDGKYKNRGILLTVGLLLP